MEFTNDFEKNEVIAREALLELNKKYNLFTGDIHFTTDTYSAYDAFYFIIDDVTHNIKKRVYIELKIRSRIFDSYLLESKKMNSLLKIRKDMYFTEDEATILYINFCPNETIIYNIDKVKNLPTEKLIANKCTVNSKTDKIEKTVIMLKPTDGKQIEYIINENEIIKRLEIKQIVKNIEKEMKNGLELIFDKYK
jgi:hypothetical protein